MVRSSKRITDMERANLDRNEHLQSSCTHHILGDAVPCSMIYGMDGYLTSKTAKTRNELLLYSTSQGN